MKALRLVTRADDAGLNRAANRAIRSAAKEGIVRNISLMAPAPAIEDGADVLAGLAGRVDFGIHVVLTSEWENVRWGPVRADSGHRPAVRRDGTFHLLVNEVKEEDPSPEWVRDEVTAQYEKLTGLGFTISYLDEHMLVGEIGSVREVLADFAAAHDLVYDRELHESGRLQELPGWQGPGEHPGTELADHLSGLEPSTYLLAGHPGTKDDEMQRLRLPGGNPGAIAMERNRERRMFMDIEIVDYCENVRVELTRYSELQQS